MKILRRTVMIVAISCIVLAGIEAIGFIFGIVKADDASGKLCFTLLTIGISSLVSLNAFILLEKKINIFAIISILLIFGCATAILYTIWTGHWKWDDFNKITLLASLGSVLLNFMVTTALRIGKRLIPLQIITYLAMGLFDLCIYMLIYKFSLLGEPFVYVISVDIVVSLVLMLVLAILRKKAPETEEKLGDQFIKIEKKEYEELQQRIKDLEAELENYKNNEISINKVTNDDTDKPLPLIEDDKNIETNKEWTCEYCGSVIIGGKFCTNCGRKKDE